LIALCARGDDFGELKAAQSLFCLSRFGPLILLGFLAELSNLPSALWISVLALRSLAHDSLASFWLRVAGCRARLP
jgi:hypothetical protein